MQRKEALIDKTSLGRQAAEVIRTRIMMGTYALGSRLIEEELAGEFQISRACIRDAFMTLESEGMVSRERNRCTHVLQFTRDKTIQLFTFRRYIEYLGLETCIHNGTMPILEAELQLDALRHIPEGDALEFVKTDMAFHETFVRASQNIYAINAWEGLKGQLITLMYTMFSQHQMDFTNDGLGEHEQILDSVKRKDLKNAKRMLEKHIEFNLNDYIRKLD